jgi:predicted aspartyl protease
MFATILLAAMAAVPASNSATVPFTLFDNRMLVQVSLDNKGPFTMIVDTGSGEVVVTPSVARSLGLSSRRAGFASGAGSASAAFSVTRVPAVTIGSLRFGDTPAEVLDLSQIRHAFGFPRLDGIIGYSILHRFRVGIDMDDQRMTLAASSPAVPKTAASVPFTVGDGLIHVPAAVNGVDGSFIIDTGDRSSLTLFRHFAQANNFYRDAPVRNVVTGIGIGGPIYSDVMRTTVSLFGTTISGVVTRASRDRGGAFAVGTDDASVGQGLLKRFNIVYDYPDRTIFAWPSRFFHNADRYVPLAFDHGVLRAGQPGSDPTILPTPSPRLPRHAVFGARVAQSAGVVRASFVVAGSPAAQAGLLAGDVIRAIGRHADRNRRGVSRCRSRPSRERGRERRRRAKRQTAAAVRSAGGGAGRTR